MSTSGSLSVFPGAWALSLAEEVPSSVSLTAIDIQSKIFPESFPQNVEFLLHSVMDLPSQWTDTFSLVNQRFLYTALTGPQWQLALGELHRVIAPGGWVQLVEGAVIPGYMGPFSSKISNLWSALFAHRALLVDIMRICCPKRDSLTCAVRHEPCLWDNGQDRC